MILSRFKRMFCRHKDQVLLSVQITKDGDVTEMAHFLRCVKCKVRKQINYLTPENRITITLSEEQRDRLRELSEMDLEEMWLDRFINTTEFAGLIRDFKASGKLTATQLEED